MLVNLGVIEVAALVRVSVISEWCGPERVWWRMREGRWWCFQEGNQSADWVMEIV